MQTTESILSELRTDLEKGLAALSLAGRNRQITDEAYAEVTALRSMLKNAGPEVKAKIQEHAEMLATTICEEGTTEEVSPEEAKLVEAKKAYFKERGKPSRVVLEAIQVTKSYKSSFELAGVDVTLRLGEVTGLVGHNGQGKTTLLRLLSGEMYQDTGEIYYYLEEADKKQSDWQKIKRQMAYLPQELKRIPGRMRTALELAASVHGIRGVDNKRQCEYIIHRLGLSEHVDKVWDDLAGGYKLRFSLAQILIRKPKVLIMDEPLASLDVHARNTLLYDLRELASSLTSPIAVLLSSQHIEEIESVSATLILLKKGKQIYSGPAFQINSGSIENTFEIESSLGFEAIRNALGELEDVSISDTGFSFLVITPRKVDMPTILRYIADKEIPVRSVRDITNSIRKSLL